MLRGELFSTEMVKAALEGRKLHTARPIKEPPPDVPSVKFREITKDGMARFEWDCSTNLCERKPKHHPGDYIYCRETWGRYQTCNGHSFAYKGDYIDTENEEKARRLVGGWRPSIHMPREAARLFFRISKVEVMRLEDVTEEFAVADGFQEKWDHSLRFVVSAEWSFRDFWFATYGCDARWMWVYWMELCSRSEAMGDG